LLVFLGLGAFIVYSTWAAFQGKNFFVDAGGAHYLSPMYSPVIFDPVGVHSGHALFGEAPKWFLNIWPGFITYSPAFLILIFPGLFRFTCYYYRGAYYKAFWLSPSNCTVGKPLKGYRGEAKFPLILQNIHRYFMYVAIVFIGILSYDAVMSYTWIDPDTKSRVFGVGLGSLVLTINPILLGGYTFGCHSLRHLVGGRKDCVSTAVGGALPYKCVSCLNSRHMRWAWASLFWVGFTDFYVRMCASGAWIDWRIF